MQPTNYHTYNEIKSQPEAWAQALVEVARIKSMPNPAKFGQVIFTGCGSTYYLALAAAALYQELTGRAVQAVQASELLLDPQTVVGQDTISPYL